MAAPENYKKLGTIGVAYKGDYNPEQTYKKTNTVYYNGSTYIALIDNPMGEPKDDGVNWKYFAKGASGEGAVSSVNGKKGAVELTADDVSALSKEGTAVNSIKWNGFAVSILTKEAYQELIDSGQDDPLTFYWCPKNSEDMAIIEDAIRKNLDSAHGTEDEEDEKP